mmetsp:Transcript_9400/g.32040  ORF Transcript_9400/g.32040 Transcript_9400/m.32040 type:complete len:381 (+) Transcript_9400:37-1179(+)
MFDAMRRRSGGNGDLCQVDTGMGRPRRAPRSRHACHQHEQGQVMASSSSSIIISISIIIKFIIIIIMSSSSSSSGGSTVVVRSTITPASPAHEPTHGGAQHPRARRSCRRGCCMRRRSSHSVLPRAVLHGVSALLVRHGVRVDLHHLGLRRGGARGARAPQRLVHRRGAVDFNVPRHALVRVRRGAVLEAGRIVRTQRVAHVEGRPGLLLGYLLHRLERRHLNGRAPRTLLARVGRLVLRRRGRRPPACARTHGRRKVEAVLLGDDDLGHRADLRVAAVPPPEEGHGRPAEGSARGISHPRRPLPPPALGERPGGHGDEHGHALLLGGLRDEAEHRCHAHNLPHVQEEGVGDHEHERRARELGHRAHDEQEPDAHEQCHG